MYPALVSLLSTGSQVKPSSVRTCRLYHPGQFAGQAGLSRTSRQPDTGHGPTVVSGSVKFVGHSLLRGGVDSRSVGLTIHSSRTRFAGRLNSGVRPSRRISRPCGCSQVVVLGSSRGTASVSQASAFNGSRIGKAMIGRTVLRRIGRRFGKTVLRQVAGTHSGIVAGDSVSAVG